MLKNLDSCPSAQGTTPIMSVAGKTSLHCRRFVCGHILDGLRLSLLHVASPMREATSLRLTVSPASISNFFVWVFVFFGVWCFLFGCLFALFCFPFFRDQSSRYAKLNDRLSCHGAHGMGEKKLLPVASSHLRGFLFGC